MISFCRLFIDHTALSDNFSALVRRVAPARVAATLKADAYGLGVRPIAQTLAQVGCRDFFVATPLEGWTVRQVVPRDARIYIFAGVQQDSLEDIIHHDLIPVLNSSEQIALWQEAGQKSGRKLPAMLHVDTGLTRLGLPYQALSAPHAGAALAEELHHIELAGLMSHLACATSKQSTFNQMQLKRFQEVQTLFPGVPACLGNSAGLHLSAAFHMDIVRPGIALYGICVAHDESDHGLKMVLRLQARVLQIKHVDAGESIGYGQTFYAQQAMKVAILGMGYADGFPRRLSDKACVWFGNYRAPVVGRVSMDMMAVDVSSVPESRVGSDGWATIFENPSHISTLAELADTVEHDILAGLGARIERIHFGE